MKPSTAQPGRYFFDKDPADEVTIEYSTTLRDGELAFVEEHQQAVADSIESAIENASVASRQPRFSQLVRHEDEFDDSGRMPPPPPMPTPSSAHPSAQAADAYASNVEPLEGSTKELKRIAIDQQSASWHRWWVANMIALSSLVLVSLVVFFIPFVVLLYDAVRNIITTVQDAQITGDNGPMIASRVIALLDNAIAETLLLIVSAVCICIVAVAGWSVVGQRLDPHTRLRNLKIVRAVSWVHFIYTIAHCLFVALAVFLTNLLAYRATGDGIYLNGTIVMPIIVLIGLFIVSSFFITFITICQRYLWFSKHHCAHVDCEKAVRASAVAFSAESSA